MNIKGCSVYSKSKEKVGTVTNQKPISGEKGYVYVDYDDGAGERMYQYPKAFHDKYLECLDQVIQSQIEAEGSSSEKSDKKENIEEYLVRIYSLVKKTSQEKIKGCELDYSGGKLPDYSKQEVQLIYALRYSYAFAYEYRKIFESIINKNSISELQVNDCFRILSIGCGNMSDAWAIDNIVHNKKINIEYDGVDLNNWGIETCMHVSKKMKVNSINSEGVAFVEQAKEINYDVICFPKSIGELSEADFYKLKSVLPHKTITKDNFYLIASFRMETNYEKKDFERFDELCHAFQNLGYSFTGCIQGTGNSKGIIADDPDYGKIKDYIVEYCKKTTSREPILTQKYINYKIMRFYRKG